MFPNLRLLIAALFASVVALSCGFGMFAAFRVNHEPLDRLPADTAALQLVADDAAPSVASWGAPFGARFRLSEARIGAAAATDAPALTPIRHDEVEPPNPWTVTAERITESAQRPASQPALLFAPQAGATTADMPAPSATPHAAPESAPATADITPAAAASTPAPTQLAPGTRSETQPVEVSAEARPSEAADKTAESGGGALPTVAAIQPAADQLAPVAGPAEITGSTAEAAITEEATSPRVVGKLPMRTIRKTARAAAKTRRVAAKTASARRSPAPTVAQFGAENSTFREPIFQSAPDAQRQPTKSHQPTRKTAARNSPSGAPFGGVNGQ